MIPDFLSLRFLLSLESSNWESKCLPPNLSVALYIFYTAVIPEFLFFLGSGFSYSFYNKINIIMMMDLKKYLKKASCKNQVSS